LLIIVGSKAVASNWVKYATDFQGDTFYVDTESLKTEDDIISFTGLRDMAEPGKRYGAFSAVGTFKINCSERKILLLKYDFFSSQMGQGDLINSFPIQEKDWFEPKPNTIGFKQVNFVCKK
tara:strand:- start:16 stop:378 length:363 start_codon:yes stop_codon:yes gene_type:complete